jgi:hypothetical protein
MSMKNLKGTIGNRTCDLPVCSAVPQRATVFVQGTNINSENNGMWRSSLERISWIDIDGNSNWDGNFRKLALKIPFRNGDFSFNERCINCTCQWQCFTAIMRRVVSQSNLSSLNPVRCRSQSSLFKKNLH